MKEKLCMLIVDDMEINRASLSSVFSDAYNIVEAADGIEALERLGQFKIHIVILDLDMPRMDGIEVIRTMKSTEEYRNIPIVVKTFVGEKSEAEVLELGADDFILSPFDTAVIRKRVNNIVTKYILEYERLQNKIMAEQQLNRAKGAFLAQMSHELRTPISAITGLAELNSSSADVNRNQDAFRKIKSQAQYLLALVNDVLDMSAIENEKLSIVEKPFQLNQLLASVSETYYAQCRQKNIDFAVKIDELTEECLIGDHLRMKQILLNLLSNAYKYTDVNGRIVFSVAEHKQQDNKVVLHCEVTDTGCGISEATADKIWEPFERDIKKCNEGTNGSGLGLAITKNLVTLMNGTIHFDSLEGIGTTFYLDIPLQTAEHQLIDVSCFSNIKALVVDDDDTARRFMSSILGHFGIVCDTAASGEEALELLNRAYREGRGYDICFADWKMPGITGIDVTREIRKLFDEDTIVIVVSAYDFSEIEGEAMAAGANEMLAKPYFQSSVFDLLISLCKKESDRQEEMLDTALDLSGKRVLMVEDNAINAEVLDGYLQRTGISVDYAINGKIATELFEAQEEDTYDIVLMDVNMPVMDGYEATRKIRMSRRMQGKTIPIIAITANAFAEDAVAAYDAGMDGHIAKPINPKVLFETLNIYLQ